MVPPPLPDERCKRNLAIVAELGNLSKDAAPDLGLRHTFHANRAISDCHIMVTKHQPTARVGMVSYARDEGWPCSGPCAIRET